MTVTLCFHNSALPSFAINVTFDMLQQQEAVFWMHKFWIVQTRLHVPFDARAPIYFGHGVILEDGCCKSQDATAV